MIAWVTLEIPKDLVPIELEFWSCLEYSRTYIKTRQAPRTEWIRAVRPPDDTGPRFWIHLIPVDKASPLSYGHLTIVPRDYPGSLTRVRKAGGEVCELESFWGAERALIVSPAGNLIELLETHPPPKSGPPSYQKVEHHYE